MSDKTICTTCLRLKQGLCDGEKELTACPSYKRMTNADRIRAMTDEELAKMLSTSYDCYWCPVNCQAGEHGLRECKETILGWLKQEVEE